MIAWLNSYFEVHKKESSIQVEILAGVSTFLSLSYIFIVNPAILAQAGMNKTSVLFATIITSGIATVVMGLWGKLPFALAPGMEMNAYVAFFVVGVMGFTWQESLGAVFWSGIIFVVLTLTRIREKIIEAIPDRMKAGLSLCVGVFLCLIALRISGLIVYKDIALEGLGSFATISALGLYVSLVVILLLDKLKIPGAVLIGIIFASVLIYFLGGVETATPSTNLSVSVFSQIGQLNPLVILNPKMLSVILILFLLDFYGSVAKLIGLTRNTNILIDGRLPRAKEALLIDGAATVFGSVLGTSSITIYVESGVGIGVGGRTGLTAVICGLLMLSCIFLAPFLGFVPLAATTGALVYVSIKLCPSWKELISYERSDIVILLLMQIVVIATFAIDKAMLVGFAAYITRELISSKLPNKYLLASTVLLLIGSILQIF